MDRKEIYPPKNKNYFRIKCYPCEGPCFTSEHYYCIQLLEKKKLFTYEEKNKEFFNGEINALSEDGKFKGIKFKEYEAFQIIFWY